MTPPQSKLSTKTLPVGIRRRLSAQVAYDLMSKGADESPTASSSSRWSATGSTMDGTSICTHPGRTTAALRSQSLDEIWPSTYGVSVLVTRL